MSSAGRFTGEDRFEVVPSFGRPVRLGRPEALRASDGERVARLLASRDAAGATAYVQSLVPHYDMIVTTYLEWAMATLALIALKSGAPAERELARETFTIWRQGLDSAPAGIGAEAILCLEPILDPERARPGAVETFRGPDGSAGCPTWRELNSVPFAHRDRCLAAIGGCAWDEARKAFVCWQAAARDRHDGIGRYVSILGGGLARRAGQSQALDIMQEGLESCAALGGMWGFVASAGPEDVALMLAEHLRAHFSGAARDGAVEVVDEPDRIRLVFAPCGSGGAMRRAGFPGQPPLPEATPETWHRAGEVPAYCAHCAKNELTSLARFGRLAWVTEFDPDPAKPCGWTVYKDPARVPAEYYLRLGVKPPEK